MDSPRRLDRPRAAFLFALALVGVAYVGLLYQMPSTLRAVGIVAPMALALALGILRVWRKHYEYRMAQLMAQPVSAVQHTTVPRRSGVGEPIVRPVYISDSVAGGRHHVR